jgi:ABC-type branched-subunit amino acid transport system ATPase component
VDQIIALLLRLNAQGTAVIMIEHIMRAVTAFAERLVVFVAGPQDRRRRARARCWACARWRTPILAAVASLEIAGLDAGYGAVRVLEHVSLSVPAGQTVVLLGTNGNGKTTLMRSVMGLVRPSAGQRSAPRWTGGRWSSAASRPSRWWSSASCWCRRGGGCSRA